MLHYLSLFKRRFRFFGFLLVPLFLSFSFKAFAAVPRVHHVYISGTTPGANPATFTSMEIGFVLQAYYTYADAANKPESGTTFQWYTYTDQFGSNKTAIPGATTSVLWLNPAQAGLFTGLFISVVITPRNATEGFGLPVEFKAFSPTNANVVLPLSGTCGKAGGGTLTQGNHLDASAPLCSPRPTTWLISYTGIDYRYFEQPKVYVNWADGSGLASYTATLQNSLLTLSDTINLTNQANQTWQASATHTYDYSATSTPSATANQVCTYNLLATWGTQSFQCSSSGVQQVQFTVWDKEDNANLGTFDINHDPSSAGVESGEVTSICEKDQSAIRLEDASDFNCTAVGTKKETINENNQARWIQWVYGTSTNITTGAGAGQQFIINGVSYNTSDLPVYGKVTYQPASTTAPLPSITDNIQMPTTATSGQTFVVTMRSWNTCNPLDLNVADGNGFNPPQSLSPPTSSNFNITGTTNQPGLISLFPTISGPPILANSNPVTRTYTIAIITKPPVAISNDKSFCSGTVINSSAADGTCPATCTTCFELTSASVTGSTVINWYFGNPTSGGVLLTNKFTTNCRFFKTSGLASTGAQGTMKTALTAGTTGTYTLYATYSTANGCTSDPVPVNIVIKEALTTPSAISPSAATNLCAGATGQVLSTTPVTGTNPLGGAWVYNWDLTSAPGLSITSGSGSASITYSVSSGASGAQTVKVNALYSTADANGSFCPTSVVSKSNITIDQTPVGGSITGATSTCAGVSPGTFTSTGVTGTIVTWQKDAVDISPAVTTTTYTPPAADYASAGSHAYTVKVKSSPNGVCPNVISSPLTLTINALPTAAAVSGGGIICSGSSATLSVAITGSTATYTVKYKDDLNNQTTVSGYHSGDPITVSPGATRTYSLVSVVDANGCIEPTGTFSGSALVTVRTAPAVTANPGNVSNLCEDAPTSFSVTANGSNLTFQWYRDPNTGVFAPITDGFTDGASTYTTTSTATGSTLSINTTGLGTTLNNYRYYCLVSGFCNPTASSSIAKLTMTAKPKITIQPIDQVACLNSGTSFGVTATGVGLTYQWQVDATGTGTAFANVPNSAPYSNVTSATLNISPVTPSMDGYLYNVIVSGTCMPSVTSNNAKLTAKGPIVTITNGATGSVCTNNDLFITAMESYSGSASFQSRKWTGVFTPTAGVPAALTDLALQALFKGSPTSTLSPTFNAAATGTYALTLTTTDAGSPTCTGSAVITITVGQVSAAPTPSPGTVCAGTALTLDGHPTGGSGIYTAPGGHLWTVTGGPTTNVLSSTTVQTPTFNDNFFGSAAGGTYTLTYKATDNGGCSFTSAPITITVNPAPNLSTTLDKHACSSVATGLSLSGTGAPIAAVTYNIVSRTVDSNLTQTSAVITTTNANGVAANYLAGETFRNNTNVSKTVQYVIAAVGANGCAGPQKTVTITVDPEPRMARNLDAKVCSGATTGLTLAVDASAFGSFTTPSVAAPSYNVTNRVVQSDVNFVPITQVTVSNPTSYGVPSNYLAGEVYKNTSGSDKTVKYTIQPVSSQPCTGSSYDITITYASEPTAKSTPPEPAICSGSPFSITPQTHNVNVSPGNSVPSTFTWTANYGAVTGGLYTGTPIAIALNGPLSETLVNKTGSPITVVYTLTPTSATSTPNCTGTPFLIQVPVNPQPVGFNDTSPIICSDASVSYDLQATNINNSSNGNSVSSDFSWIAQMDYPNVTGESYASAQTTSTITDNLVNVSGSDQTVIYNVTPTSKAPNSCPGAVFTVSVKVHPKPYVASVPVTIPAICSDATLNHVLQNDLTNSAVLSDFTWKAQSNSNVTGETLTLQTTGTITDQLFNVSSTDQTVKYDVTATSKAPNSCVGSSFVVQVTVHPKPVGVTTSAPNICSSSSVGYNLQTQNINISAGLGGNSVSSTFSWKAQMDFPNVTGESFASAKTTTTINDVLVNTSGSDQIVKYDVTPTSSASCVGAVFTISVLVHSEANITTQPAASVTTCETGSTSTGSFSFSVVATGPGLSYQWQQKTPSGTFTNISDGTVSGVTYSGSTTANLSVSGTTYSMNNNQYRVVMTTTGSCVATSSVAALIVNQLPAVTNPTQTYCSDAPGGTLATVNLELINSIINNGSNLTFTWWQDATASTTPIISGSAPNQTQKYPVNNGDFLYARVHNTVTNCDNIAQTAFIVNTTPSLNAITGPGSVCVSSNNVYYQVTQHGTAKYKWTVPTGFNVVAGGGKLLGGVGTFTDDYFILLNFTSATPPGGLDITMTEESSAGCIGPVNTRTITVSNSPPTITIENYPSAAQTSFCKSQLGVTFQVPNSQYNPTSNYIWTLTNPSGLGTDATILGAQAGTGLQQIVVNMGTKAYITLGVQEINVAGCPGTNTPQTFNLVDAPVMIPQSPSICSGQQPSTVLNMVDPSNGTPGYVYIADQPSTFQWIVTAKSPNVTGPNVNDTGTGAINHTFPITNVSGTVGSITYRITPTATASPNCLGVYQDYTVTVNPEPVVNSITDVNFCPGTFVTVSSTSPVASPTLSSNVSGATINWTSSNPAVSLGSSLAASGSGTISFTAAANTTGATISSLITVTATSAFGCTSAGANVKTFNLNLLPNPVVNPVTNVEVCSGGSISSISFSSNTGGGETYRWTNSNTAIGLSSSGTLNIPSYTAPVNITGVPIVGTINVFGKLNGCEGAATTFTITIQPQPAASPSNNAPVVCNGDTPDFTFDSNTSPGVPTDLTFDIVPHLVSGITATGIANTGVSGITKASLPYHFNSGTLTNTTDSKLIVQYEIVPKLAGCPNGPSQYVSVTVQPTPKVTFTNSAPVICNGAQPNIAFSSPTTPNNTSDLTFDVTVSIPIGVSASGIAGSGLSGVSVPFFINSGNITNTSLTHQTVKYFATPKLNGCASGTPVEVDVEVEPTPQVDVPISNLTPTICNGGTPNIQFTTSTVPTNAANLTFDVNVSMPSGVNGTGVAGSGIINGTAPLFINSGTLTNTNNTYQTVTYTITPKLNGCPNGTQRTVSVKVEPTPLANTPTNNTPIICNGTTPDFLFTSPTVSSNPSDLVFDISVNIPGGVSGSGLVFTGVTGVTATASAAYELNSGSLTNSNNSYATVVYTITPRIGSTCIAGPTQTVTVLVEPTPSFNVTNSPSTICNNGTPNIAVTSPTSPAPSTNLTFDVTVSMPGGVSGAGVAASGYIGATAPFFINSGTLVNTNDVAKTVKYTVTPKLSGCGTGTPQDILVVVEPTPTISFTNNSPRICSGASPSINLASPTVPSIPANLTFDVVANLPTGVTGTLVAGGGELGVTATSFAINTGTLTNTTNSFKTVTYTITPKLNGCANGPAQVVSVIVEPVPTLTFANNAPTVCNNGTPNILVTSSTSTSTPSDLTFDVTVSMPAGVSGSLLAGNGILGASAPFSINTGTLTNTNTSFATVVYRITPKLNGCANGPYQDVSVIVEPTPQVDAPVNNIPVVCNGGAPSIDITTSTTPSIPGNLTFDVVVTLPAGLTGTGAAASSATGQSAPFSINSGSLTNSTNSYLTATYQITPRLNGCASGTPKTVTVDVEPTPQVTFTNNLPSICSDGTPDITFSSPTSAKNSGNLKFDVTVSLPTGVSGGGVAANGLTNATLPFSINSGVLTHDNLTNNVLVVTYTITPKLGACASGPPQQVLVNVRPKPVGVSSSNAAPALDVCSQQSFSYDIQGDNINTLGNQVNSTFTFTVASSDETNVPTPSGLDRTTASSANITGSFTNRTNVDVFITYHITPFNVSGNCQGVAFDVVVAIHPEPYPLASPPTLEVCSGIALDVDLQSMIRVVAGNTLNSTFTYTLTADHPVDLSPTVFPGTFDRTSPSTAHITDLFTNRNPNGNGDVTLTYTVTPYSVAENCKGSSFIVKVIVHPEPVGQNYVDNVCATTLNHDIQTQITNSIASEFIYTVSSDNGGVAPAADRTSYSNSFITDVYTNNTGTPAIITYTITARSSAHACVVNPAGAPTNTFTYKVTVSPTPVANAGPLTAGPFCSDAPFSIDPQTYIGNGVALTTYDWTVTYGGGLTGTLPASGTTTSGVAETIKITGTMTNITGAAIPITFHITPYSGVCAGTPFDVVVNIQPKPVMKPSLASATICSTNAASSNPLGVTLATIAGGIAADHYNITLKSQDAGLIGTPTVGTGLAASAIANDTYSNTTASILKVIYTVVPVSSVANGGCSGDPFDITITVNPEPVLYNPGYPAVCSTNTNSNNPVGVVLGTNGTSVNAASYKLTNIQYDAGSGFSSSLPANFTRNAGGSVVSIGASGDINLVKSDTYTNTTAGPVTVRYTIQATSPQGCLSTLLNYDVVVNPQPTFTPTLSPLCSGLPSGIVLTNAAGSQAIAQYLLKQVLLNGTVTAAPGNATLGTYSSGNFLANDVYTNTTNAPITVTYTIAPITAAGCLGPDQHFDFTVNPAPAVSNNLNATVCSNDAAGIVLSTDPSSFAVATYTINNIVLQGALVRAAGNNSFPRTTSNVNELSSDRFTNNTNAPLTVTYTVIPTTAAGCNGPAKDIILTVEPNPTVDITTATVPGSLAQTICSNGTTDIVMDSQTTPTAGTIVFNYTASSTSGLVSGFIPAVNNLPKLYKIADNLVNNDNVAHTVTYTITPVALGAKGGLGCSGTPKTVIVTVEPKPKLTASPSVKTICESDGSNSVPVNVSLTTTTVPSAGTIVFVLTNVVPTGGVTGYSPLNTVYTPGALITDQLSNPTTSPQTVTYTLTPQVSGGLGCAGDLVTVTITVNPRPTITASPQAPICNGDFINITLTPDVTDAIATWSVTTPVSGNITGAAAGSGNLIFQTLFNKGSVPEIVTYNITPKASGCNGPTINVPVTVNPKPKLTIPSTFKVCHGNSFTYNLAGNTTTDPASTNFSWTVDDPSGLGTPGSFDGSGSSINQMLTNTTGSQATLTYTISVTGPGACPGDQKIVIVTVSPQMAASFGNADSFICKGSSDYLLFQLSGQAPFNFVYNDGTSDIAITKAGNVKVIQVTPSATTTYTIKSMTDAFGCPLAISGQSVTVTVGETNADFSIVGPGATCSPYQVSFQHNQVAGTEYTWQWFDGTDDSTYVASTSEANKIIKHTFVNPSPTGQIVYKVTLRTDLPAPFPGCIKSATKNVTVYPTIVTNVFPDRSVICSGETVKFANQSLGASTNRWFYRVQGTTTEIDVRTTQLANYALVNNSTANPIVYEVVYQANNGNCPAPDVVMPISVFRGVSASFDPGTIPPFIGGNSTVTFTNTSVPVDPTEFTFSWDFGLNATPGTSTSPGPVSVNYSTPGSRDVVLTVVNTAATAAGLSCDGQYKKTIYIPLLPLVAAFKAAPQESCFPTDITVTENTSTGDQMDWRLVDGNGRVASTSNAVLPVFHITNPGTYSIFLKTSSSLTGQIANAQQDKFEVYDVPLASFDLRPNIVYVPDTEMNLFNFSSGASDYIWDFGNGDTSTDFEPSYKYKIEGVYDVTLYARDDHGNGVVCIDTLKRQVVAKQGGLTKIPNAFTPSTTGPNGGVAGNNSFNDVFLPLVKGVEEFNMQIFDRWGNLIFESNDSTIGWDGYDKNGRLLPAGVYVFKLTLRLSDSQRTTQVGDVTLIR